MERGTVIRGLPPVAKILSSTYCILIIAIYVVIVVNRVTQEDYTNLEVRQAEAFL